MKIYLLWEAYGEYEDYREEVIGCYLTKERATQELEEKEKEEKLKKQQYYHCQSCIAFHSVDFSENDIDCKDLIFKKDKFNGCWCENMHWGYELTIYWIKEMEVIE